MYTSPRSCLEAVVLNAIPIYKNIEKGGWDFASAGWTMSIKGCIGMAECSANVKHSISLKDLRTKTADLTYVKEWLEHCLKFHHQCRSSDGSSYLPIRVIDCETKRLVLTLPEYEYAALSYVWGSSQVSSAIKYRKFCDVVPEDIPRVVEDAISVAKKLSTRYL
jgi:hypothetical protein